MISYIDQTAIGIALPTIAIDLNAGSTIIWTGTSSMISNTVFQVLSGRMSDIFGRKVVMLMSLDLFSETYFVGSQKPVPSLCFQSNPNSITPWYLHFCVSRKGKIPWSSHDTHFPLSWRVTTSLTIIIAVAMIPPIPVPTFYG